MSNSNMREELLGLDTQDPELRARYEGEVSKLLEKRLTPGERVVWVLFTLLGFVFMIGFAGVALLVGPDMPWQGRAMFGGGAIFGALWAALCIRILRHGTFHLRRDSYAMFGLTWVFLVLMTVASLLVSGLVLDSAKGTQMVVSVLTFLVLFGLPLTWGRIAESELRLREYILGLRLELEELLEKESR